MLVGIRHYSTDQIGLPRELSNTAGNIQWRADYKVWGNTLTVEYPEAETAPEAIHQPLRFQGQYYDAETGLHYNRFRYYDPDIGRFVTQDPIGLDGGDNLYQYAPNPGMWIDPLGLTGAYFFTDGKTSYIGKGPRRRVLESLRARIGGIDNATQCAHLDFGSDTMGFMVEYVLMRDHNAMANSSFANNHRRNSPGKTLFECR